MCSQSCSLSHTHTHVGNFHVLTIPSLKVTCILHITPLALTSWHYKPPPGFSALSRSHVPILRRKYSLPLNPTVADGINEVSSQPRALRNTLITSACLA